MDYIKETIEYLKSYKDLEVSRMNLQDKINIINAEIGGQAISYKDTSGGSGQEPDDALLNRIFQRDRCKEQLTETLRVIGHIEKAFNSFETDNDQYGKLLRSWLIENKSLEYTAEQLGVTERHIYRIKNQALKKFAIQLFGIRVIK